MRRDHFLKRYRALEFKEGSEELERLLSQCAEYMGWIEIDSVRNDLAISQFHSGDFFGCLKTLAATRAARYTNEEMLMEQMPPFDRDNYLAVAKAAWHNKTLCENGSNLK